MASFQDSLQYDKCSERTRKLRNGASSYHVAHKASTQPRQPALSAAAICTSLQFFHAAFSFPLSAVFLHNEHYQLATIDEVASRPAGAQKFALCDTKDDFHQIRLDDVSSYFTTFNTPFVRYVWTRIPFGISSAPEGWPRRMHEISMVFKSWQMTFLQQVLTQPM